METEMLDLKFGDLLKYKSLLPEGFDEDKRVYHLILEKDKEGYKYLSFSSEKIGEISHSKHSSHPFYHIGYWEKVN